MIKIQFSRYILASTTLIISAFILVGIVSAIAENKSNESNSTISFSKIYIDGFDANSNGYKLLLRTYERRMDSYYQPFIADIDFILMDDGKIIYNDTVKQVSLLSDRQGTTEIISQPHIALKEGRNYTALAKIYLNENGIPKYYVTATSTFTAKSDAAITDVYGDRVGASATIKSKSLVQLNATIVFSLTQDDKLLETKEITAPSIMSHDKEKTVSVLWDRNMDYGIYMVSVALQGNDLVAKYDKVFTVEKEVVVANSKPVESSSNTMPGFTSFSAIIVIIFLSRKRCLKLGT